MKKLMNYTEWTNSITIDKHSPRSENEITLTSNTSIITVENVQVYEVTILVD